MLACPYYNQVRFQIVNDVFQFARSGLMNYTQAFNILSFLENETEYTPWVAALTGFNWIRNRFRGTPLLAQTEVSCRFMLYVLNRKLSFLFLTFVIIVTVELLNVPDLEVIVNMFAGFDGEMVRYSDQKSDLLPSSKRIVHALLPSIPTGSCAMCNECAGVQNCR